MLLRYYLLKNLEKKCSKDDFQFKVSFKYLDSIRRDITNYKHEIIKDKNNMSTMHVSAIKTTVVHTNYSATRAFLFLRL